MARLLPISFLFLFAALVALVSATGRFTLPPTEPTEPDFSETITITLPTHKPRPRPRKVPEYAVIYNSPNNGRGIFYQQTYHCFAYPTPKNTTLHHIYANTIVDRANVTIVNFQAIEYIKTSNDAARFTLPKNN